MKAIGSQKKLHYGRFHQSWDLTQALDQVCLDREQGRKPFWVGKQNK